MKRNHNEIKDRYVLFAGNRNLTNNRLVWKRFLGQICGRLPNNTNRRVILSYHSVGSGPLSLPVEKFHALYEAVKAKKFGHLTGGIDREGRDFLTVYFTEKRDTRRPD